MFPHDNVLIYIKKFFFFFLKLDKEVKDEGKMENY